MIAIHNASGEFTNRWISYCETNKISYKIVDCYKSNIIKQLYGCSALMWQFYQGSPQDIIMAKPLMNALEHTGFKTFPDFKTSWHFDDKIGQKYLLELIGDSMVPTWVFYKKNDALQWIKDTTFPKVFKLRNGAGSRNVRLVKSRTHAKRLIRKSFGRGVSVFDPFESLKERLRLFKLHKSDFKNILEGLARFIILPAYARIQGRAKGYTYFQDFIRNNDSDIRVVVIKNKAFAIKRMVRKDDFRASGSGHILYDKELIDESTIRLSFEIAEKMQSQCVAFDFVFDDRIPLIIEVSYGFSAGGYDLCPGYWDNNMEWHEGAFNPYGWMVDLVLE